jgi:hypothetical protein
VTTFLIAGPIVDKASERKAILNPGSQRVNHDKIGEYHTFSLIFPVPCEFIDSSLPQVAIIRPLTDKFAGAVAAVASLTADGLFTGQSRQYLATLQQLAYEADAVVRL